MVPKDSELRNQILDDAHSSKLFIHLGSSKMYQDLKTYFWWTKMKKEIVAFVARCNTCSRVKVDLCWIAPTFICSRTEVGGHQHGLYCWTSTHSERVLTRYG